MRRPKTTLCSLVVPSLHREKHRENLAGEEEEEETKLPRDVNFEPAARLTPVTIGHPSTSKGFLPHPATNPDQALPDSASPIACKSLTSSGDIPYRQNFPSKPPPYAAVNGHRTTPGQLHLTSTTYPGGLQTTPLLPLPSPNR